MQFADLLGRKLKDDTILEVLETHDMIVVYEFDRTHENMDDLYWSDAKSEGFQLGFNKDQLLYVVFLYVAPSDGFSAIDPLMVPYPLYKTFEEAKAAFELAGLSYSASVGAPGTPIHKWWIKADYESHTRHYQYKAGCLFRLTLGLKGDALYLPSEPSER